jgi:ribosomal protein S6
MNNDFDHGAEGTEQELEAGYNESRVYELGFHLDPELAQEEAKRIYQGLRETATKAGSLVAEGEPQKIQLAYTLYKTENHARRDFDSAFFAWVAYEADSAGHDAVIAAAKAEPRIIRFLDIRTDKDAAKHAAEMHEIYAEAAEAARQSVPQEEVADVELDAALKEAGV